MTAHIIKSEVKAVCAQPRFHLQLFCFWPKTSTPCVPVLMRVSDESSLLTQPSLSSCDHPAATSVSLGLTFLSVLGQVGSNAGIVGMTKEHLGLALALNVPVFVVVTKIDMCPANILQGK